MSTALLIVVCVICWGVWALVLRQASVNASPLLVQVMCGYAYSAIAPLIFLYMKSTNASTQWSIAGVSWSVLSCVLASLGTFVLSAIFQRC